jgi:carbonic anhydrase/acetyltransferase-like protein (isoleucine patch superfamily)
MCVIHGAHVGQEALIANHATVLDGAVIGARSLVAAGAVVVAGTQIPAGVLVVGAPAKVKGPIAGTGAEMWVDLNPQAYRDLAQRHLAGLETI